MSSHLENMGDAGALGNCPIMPTYAAPSIMFVRRRETVFRFCGRVGSPIARSCKS